MARNTTRPAKSTRQRLKAAPKGKAARVRDRKARCKADTKAVDGEPPQWTKA